jgi:hypothetical protein
MSFNNKEADFSRNVSNSWDVSNMKNDVSIRGLPRDVAYLSRPIATSYTNPNAGEGGSCDVSANEYRTAVHMEPK